MFELAIIGEWAQFAVRWLHVITAIAWIGSSFYFIALDLGLVKRPHHPPGVSGEEWQVHAGGFYHIQKYNVAPEHMPDHLIWFKWESYMTWVSGFLMLCLLYYGGADLFLVNREALDVSAPVSILISLASLSIGWLVYDLLCKSPIGKHTVGLMLLLYVLLICMAYGYTHIFTGRAAFLHMGAFTATIMTANVFFIIIPNQKIVVADLRAGRTPDPKYGKIAKQRSTHNNYLTLPVLFFMLSNHYPLAFATSFNWVIASLVFLMGVTIRHYFNTMHARKGQPNWTWALTAIIFITIMWLSTSPRILKPEDPNTAVAPAFEKFADDPHFADAKEIVSSRCSMCHAAEPVWDGIHRPPLNVQLENDAEIAARASQIYLQAGRSHAMPPGNVTDMTPQERATLVAWYQSSIGAKPNK
ncbi:urate hydroxylase PuuD [Martelella alba]|uniref:Urate hydroxylase PuuD n=1 Tax=Martelella alba TaxID=2590451 RepID=A0A506UE37_9HYPH|nr:urate hydroxylase PuuD [Martelella alba]TPW31656.1 urate hydroxylase PuuD [Martelella alba]